MCGYLLATHRSERLDLDSTLGLDLGFLSVPTYDFFQRTDGLAAWD